MQIFILWRKNVNHIPILYVCFAQLHILYSAKRWQFLNIFFSIEKKYLKYINANKTSRIIKSSTTDFKTEKLFTFSVDSSVRITQKTVVCTFFYIAFILHFCKRCWCSFVFLFNLLSFTFMNVVILFFIKHCYIKKLSKYFCLPI